MGGIFLRRSMRPRAEVINDLGRDIANLFRILQRHYPQFIDCLRFQLTTRVEFERLVDTRPDTLADLERAARFLYLQRTAFGGKVSGRNFSVSPDRPARFNLSTLEPLLSINDAPEIREIFTTFHMQEIQVRYTLARKETARGRRGELLIRNFAL